MFGHIPSWCHIVEGERSTRHRPNASDEHCRSPLHRNNSIREVFVYSVIADLRHERSHPDPVGSPVLSELIGAYDTGWSSDSIDGDMYCDRVTSVSVHSFVVSVMRAGGSIKGGYRLGLVPTSDAPIPPDRGDLGEDAGSATDISGNCGDEASNDHESLRCSAGVASCRFSQRPGDTSRKDL